MSQQNLNRGSLLNIGLLILWIVLSLQARAGCGVHDHNCFHGSYPNDPSLGAPPSGDGTLSFGTTWIGEADINQHVAVPEDRGPHVVSNPDGNPIEQTPLGGGVNEIYHGQQQVQYSNGTATGILQSSPDEALGGGQRQELTTITGNVASGQYQHALYNYDIRENGETGAYETVITAGPGAYFEDANRTHIATGYNQQIVVNGALAPDQVSEVVEFEYKYNGFDPHALGVYAIPDGVWNIGGIPDYPDIAAPYQFEYVNTSLSQDEVAVDFLSHVMGLSQEAAQEYGGWMYNADNGGFGLSLS